MTIVEDDHTEDSFVREAVPHSDLLLRHAWRLTGQRVDAEDLVQETMLKGYLSFEKLRAGSNVKSWLTLIMVNTWIDRHRATQRRPPEQLSAEITDAQLVSHANRYHGGSRSAETEALKSLPGDAALALRRLPQEVRATIYYADIEGYRNTEVAEMLGIPVGTVASRLYRGRTLLRELLA